MIVRDQRRKSQRRSVPRGMAARLMLATPRPACPSPGLRDKVRGHTASILGANKELRRRRARTGPYWFRIFKLQQFRGLVGGVDAYWHTGLSS
jgi:hypothetical protein